jgi:hypothetical protein
LDLGLLRPIDPDVDILRGSRKHRHRLASPMPTRPKPFL